MIRITRRIIIRTIRGIAITAARITTASELRISVRRSRFSLAEKIMNNGAHGVMRPTITTSCTGRAGSPLHADDFAESLSRCDLRCGVAHLQLIADFLDFGILLFDVRDQSGDFFLLLSERGF
jgi:hypothetical protein